jgi:hypothetical protein
MQTPSFFLFFFIPCIAVKPKNTHHPTIHPFLYLPSFTGHLVLQKKKKKDCFSNPLCSALSLSLYLTN